MSRGWSTLRMLALLGGAHATATAPPTKLFVIGCRSQNYGCTSSPDKAEGTYWLLGTTASGAFKAARLKRCCLLHDGRQTAGKAQRVKHRLALDNACLVKQQQGCILQLLGVFA